MARVGTIGVYGFTLETFLEALHAADAEALIDVRQRRGVRGTEYAWANARRLQASMADAGIGYRHHRELAPTTELRQLQYAEDARTGVGKRNRTQLAQTYRERYVREILDRVDLEDFVEGLPTKGASVLLCVERDPAACHRSMIADRLHDRVGIPIFHLVP